MVDPEDKSPARPARIGVRKRGRIDYVEVARVLYVEGAGNYVELVLDDGRRELGEGTLEAMGRRLGSDFFCRIHRSYVARLGAIRRIFVRSGCRYAAELDDGTVLPVGRTRYRELRRLLEA